MKRFLLIIVALVFGAQHANAVSNRLNPTADFALINGKIHTMDANGTVAEAIAIEEDEIVYVGDADGLRNVIGIGTRVIDLKGKMVLPGFIEGHTHTLSQDRWSKPASICKATTLTRFLHAFGKRWRRTTLI